MDIQKGCLGLYDKPLGQSICELIDMVCELNSQVDECRERIIELEKANG